MAKGKRTYIAYYSTETGNIVHITHINKKNFQWKSEKYPALRKYNPKTKKHESNFKIKEIKKG